MKSLITFLILALGSQVVWAEPKILDAKILPLPPIKAGKVLELFMENDGTTIVRGQRIAPDGLAKHLATLEVGKPKEKSQWVIVIRARKDCPIKVVQNVMSECDKAGITNILFGTSTDVPATKAPVENSPKP